MLTRPKTSNIYAYEFNWKLTILSYLSQKILKMTVMSANESNGTLKHCLLRTKIHLLTFNKKSFSKTHMWRGLSKIPGPFLQFDVAPKPARQEPAQHTPNSSYGSRSKNRSCWPRYTSFSTFACNVRFVRHTRTPCDPELHHVLYR